MIRAAVILLLVAVGAHAADLDAPRFLGAIRAVEAWHGHDGRAGERGPWQITRDVWAMHMPGRPFAEARQAGPARACAVKHLAWLRDHLHAAGADLHLIRAASDRGEHAHQPGYFSGQAPRGKAAPFFIQPLNPCHVVEQQIGK